MIETKSLDHMTAVVNLPHINQLLAPADGDRLGVRLALERLHSSLDGVHGVSRSRNACREVLDTGQTANFE